jgi:hypothetical protein
MDSSATFVKMRNVFHANGRDASLGRYAFGFSWGAWAALFLSIFFFCIARRKRRDTTAAAAAPATAGPRWGWRPWRRSAYGGRRVKGEYA